MPSILDVADEVVATVTAQFAAVTTCTRKYRPNLTLEQMDPATITATVVPKDKNRSILTASTSQRDMEIDLAIQKKLITENDLSESDPLTKLLESIEDYFWLRKLPSTGATCVKAKYQPIFSQEMMQTQNSFTGVLTLTFRFIG